PGGGRVASGARDGEWGLRVRYTRRRASGPRDLLVEARGLERFMNQQDGCVTGLPLRVVALDDGPRFQASVELHAHRRVVELTFDYQLRLLSRSKRVAVLVVTHQHASRVPTFEVELCDEGQARLVQSRRHAVALVVGVNGDLDSVEPVAFRFVVAQPEAADDVVPGQRFVIGR